MKRYNCQRRGVTLVELLVMTAIGTVAFGLALGVMTTSHRSAEAITRRQALLQQGAVVMDQLIADIEAAIDPAALAEPVVPAVLTATEMNLLIHDGGLQRLRLTHEAGAVRRGLAPLAGADAAPQTRSVGSDLPEGCELSLAFGYAAATPPDRRPDYLETWPGPGLPSLIQVRLELTDPNAGGGPIAFQSAAIPGLAPARSQDSAPEVNP